MLVFLAEQLGDEREVLLNQFDYKNRLFSYHFAKNVKEEKAINALMGNDPIKSAKKKEEVLNGDSE